MNMWASRQMKQELMTGKAGLIVGGTLVFLIFLILAAMNSLRDGLRVHPVSTAAEAAAAQAEGWVAEVEYADIALIGSVVLETVRQGEVSFMMGGAVGAVPGRQVTSEEEYRVWALNADGFTAILFTNRDEVPSGSVRMDSVIEWLTESDRKELEDEYSSVGCPAYVFLLEKEEGMGFVVVCAVITLAGIASAAWLLFTKKGLMTTKFWRRMNAAGNPDEILNDLNDPQYARMGFAVARKYVWVNNRAIPRSRLQCTLQTDENCDKKIIFDCAGHSTEYYPDEEEMETLSALLNINR